MRPVSRSIVTSDSASSGSLLAGDWVNLHFVNVQVRHLHGAVLAEDPSLPGWQVDETSPTIGGNAYADVLDILTTLHALDVASRDGLWDVVVVRRHRLIFMN